MIKRERLIEVLDIDAEKGILRWRENRCRTAKKDGIAGSMTKSGYYYIVIDSKGYMAHRLIWLYVHGKFPSKHIDHINGIRHDNRLQNLREANDLENSHNIKGKRVDNTSGALGVSWHKRSLKWVAQIQVKGKGMFLGYFSDIELAKNAYLVAKRKYHPFNTL
jgi:hypothetical protein